MKNYLDTNVLYNIRNLPKDIYQDCYFSVLGLSEIIAGINETNFLKRKITLHNIFETGINHDRCFPQEIMFNSFSFFEGYQYIDNREDDLHDIIEDILHCNTFSEFYKPITSKQKKYDFDYFLKEDRFLSENFVQASMKGIAMMTDNNNEKNDVVHYNKKTFILSQKEGLKDFLNQKEVNRAITILAVASEAQERFEVNKDEKIVEKIYTSYNGLLDIYIYCFSEYSKRQLLDKNYPGRNDAQDLTHLYYLRNNYSLKIISDDKIFKRLIPVNTLTIQELISS